MTQLTAGSVGALGFGLIIGWYIYYVNRYRKAEVQFSDITTLVGAIGGAAVLALFDPGSELFGFYGIGLAVGFFGYFVFLLVFVRNSDSFNVEWFLDGRRKDPPQGWSIPGDARPTIAAMSVQPSAPPPLQPSLFYGVNPAAQGVPLPQGTLFLPDPRSTPAPPAAPAPAMLPQPAAAPDPTARSIVQACKDEWSANKADCTRFAKAVGSRFGVALTGNADDIVGQIGGPHWTRLPDGRAASKAAREGSLVVGGMTSQALGGAHGHVVVVVDGPLEHDLYPSAYWGSLNPSIRDDGGLCRGVNWSFSKQDRDSVVYGARRIRHRPHGRLKRRTAMDDATFRYCAYCEEMPGQDTEAVRFRGRAALLNSAHWGPHRNLTVGFMGGDPAIRAKVADLAREWEEAAPGGIRFSFWLDPGIDPRSADIRVAFMPGRGSWSYLGTVALDIARDQPTMNFGWLTETLPDDEFRSVVLHEFGHALGLIHEHQNPHQPIQWDVAAVTAELSGPPNKWDEDTIRANMFRRYEEGDLFATEVDATSIMMYPIPPQWTTDGFTVGFNSALSQNDRSLIAAAYPSIGI